MTTMLDELMESEAGYDGKRNPQIAITRTHEVPYRFICQIEVGGLWRGTGTLIGPRTVLTAAHVLIPDYAKGRMRITAGRNEFRWLGVATVAEFQPMPEYKPDVSPARTDVGLIHLNEAIGDEVGWWTAHHFRRFEDPRGTSILAGPLPLPAGGVKVHLSGYPGDKPAGCAGKRCGRVQYHTYDHTIKREAGLLFYENDTYTGHSGSPVWVKRHRDNGGHVLVGIHKGETNRFGGAVFISAGVRKFITDNTAE